MIALQHKTTLHILRILIGLVFITSAIFKLIGIDAFEVYMFSLQWFNLPVASVQSVLLARVGAIIFPFNVTSLDTSNLPVTLATLVVGFILKILFTFHLAGAVVSQYNV